MSDSTADKQRTEWRSIAEAGGTDAWVHQELLRQGLIDEGVDTASMGDKERKAYKARREEERRVRKILRKDAWAAYRRAHLVHVGTGVFYHDTADIDRFDIDDPEQRRQQNDLPALATAQDLAQALDLPMPRLRWLVYHREVDTGSHYHFWTVPKRSGGERLISAPKPDLKKAQRWIAEHISERLPIHGAAHGFVAGRSTVTNARLHAGAAVVVKFDLEAFYPTITFPRVKGLFRKAGYGEQVATVLALLCTESPREQVALKGKLYYVAVGPRSLPQGAPTSPSITNAICLRLDARLAGLARAAGWRYSRYADDLTFSWHRRDAAAPVGRLMRMLGRIGSDEGFALHRKKTRVLRSGRRQKVCGLVVNAAGDGQPRARVPRKIVRELRAAIRNRELGREGWDESLAELAGMASYVHMADPKKGRAFLDRIAALQAAGQQSGGEVSS
ncbi:MAG: RNA-directed DNA polymerase [Deltaproteobacteria bacterium]|nr:RNA-directed DNA polymerase [Deltaproteobacteria bacterium]